MTRIEACWFNDRYQPCDEIVLACHNGRGLFRWGVATACATNHLVVHLGNCCPGTEHADDYV